MRCSGTDNPVSYESCFQTSLQCVTETLQIYFFIYFLWKLNSYPDSYDTHMNVGDIGL